MSLIIFQSWVVLYYLLQKPIPYNCAKHFYRQTIATNFLCCSQLPFAETMNTSHTCYVFDTMLISFVSTTIFAVISNAYLVLNVELNGTCKKSADWAVFPWHKQIPPKEWLKVSFTCWLWLSQSGNKTKCYCSIKTKLLLVSNICNKN